jgi:hypothetical protein
MDIRLNIGETSLFPASDGPQETVHSPVPANAARLCSTVASKTIVAMRRVLLGILLFGLLAPSARADGFETLQALAKRHLRPAPLVPATAPAPLSDLGATLATGPGRGKGGYALRLVHYTPNGPDAVIAVSRGDYGSIKAALRAFRRDSYTKRTTRIRGRRAYLVTRRARETALVWSEDGGVYIVATGTQRKVSVSGLRATANGLEHLGANYIGDYFQPGSNNTSLGAVLVATERHVSGVVEWGTDNCTFNGFPAAAHGGSATFMLLPLVSAAFSFPLNGPLVSPSGWNGTLSGTFTPAAIDVTLQGSGTFDEESCDTGPMSVSAPARDPD